MTDIGMGFAGRNSKGVIRIYLGLLNQNSPQSHRERRAIENNLNGLLCALCDSAVKIAFVTRRI